MILFRPYLRRETVPNQPPLWKSLIWFFPFAIRVIWDILAGTWLVASMVLHLRPIQRVGIVAVPIGDRTADGVAVTSMVVVLSPGSVLLDVDWERRVMLFHVLGDATPDEVRANYQAFYDRYQRHVFP